MSIVPESGWADRFVNWQREGQRQNASTAQRVARSVAAALVLLAIIFTIPVGVGVFMAHQWYKASERPGPQESGERGPLMGVSESVTSTLQTKVGILPQDESSWEVGLGLLLGVCGNTVSEEAVQLSVNHYFYDITLGPSQTPNYSRLAYFAEQRRQTLMQAFPEGTSIIRGYVQLLNGKKSPFIAVKVRNKQTRVVELGIVHGLIKTTSSSQRYFWAGSGVLAKVNSSDIREPLTLLDKLVKGDHPQWELFGRSVGPEDEGADGT